MFAHACLSLMGVGLRGTRVLYVQLNIYIFMCRHAWADQKHRHALYRKKIPTASAISTSYVCYSISETSLNRFLGR